MRNFFLMRASVRLCLLSALLCSAVEPTQGKEAVSPFESDWKLVWADEFGTAGAPDSDKWGYERGFIRNSEDQFYTSDRRENARVENGLLIIEARKERWANPDYDPEKPEAKSRRLSHEYADYTSASLTTAGKASWIGGRFEVRAKLPQGRGVWPAIWMLGDNISEVGWPTCGELDIMEFVGFKPNTIHANVHCRKYNHAQGNGRGDKIELTSLAEDFHVYAMQWYEDRIDFYVDDHKYFTFKNEGSGNAAWPFDKPQYLILNLAIGGTWGGREGIDDSIFPQQYLIDYVRVFQLED